MERFVKGEKCLKLFEEKGNLLDIDRIRAKRFAQSGCANRFTIVDGNDIGDLSTDSFIKLGRGCYTRSDKEFLMSNLARGEKAPFAGELIFGSQIQKLDTLPPPALLGESVKNSRSKITALRKFISTVGKDLPLVTRDLGARRGVSHVYARTFGLIFSLEKEGILWVPKIHTYSWPHYFGRYIEVAYNKFCYPRDFPSEMEKVKTLPSKTRHVAIPVIVKEGEHANTMVLDRKTKKISFFEPHGLKSEGKFVRDRKKFVEKFINVFKLKGFTFSEPEETCPWFGPQSIESRLPYERPNIVTGYCETWSNMFVYCKIKFPELSDAEVHYGLTHGFTPSQLRSIVERFAAFAQDEGRKAVKNLPELWSPDTAFLLSKNPRRNVGTICENF
uniref:Uncharacterized protein n=1 Tax=Marseillevirus sp. TaxID=2809551 RepID=A0AA96J356_9VIRU|nr:hypothetical protein MarFTMF_344 [Marseillevirus sp.]